MLLLNSWKPRKDQIIIGGDAGSRTRRKATGQMKGAKIVKNLKAKEKVFYKGGEGKEMIEGRVEEEG